MTHIIEILLPPRLPHRHPKDPGPDNFWPLAIVSLAAITATSLITVVAIFRDLDAATVSTAIAAIAAIGGAAYGRLRR